MIRAVRLVALVSLFGALVACASAPPTPLTSYEVGERPELGVRTEVDVGDVVYTKYDYLEKRGAQLVEEYRDGFMLGKIAVPAGTFLQGRGGGSDAQFCSEDRFYRDPLAGPIDVVCFADKNGDQRFEMVRVPQIKFGNWKVLKTSGPRYRTTSTAGSQGFRKELIYQGISGDVIKLAYREYVNDMARPAYQQEVTYNIEPEPPTEVRFQGAVIMIFGADNNQLDYRVVEGFRD